VQHQPTRIAAKTIGENDIGTGINEALMQGFDPLRLLNVPDLGCLAGDKAHFEKIRARRAISDKGFTGCKKAGE
jgi:hypothetical protein